MDEEEIKALADKVNEKNAAAVSALAKAEIEKAVTPLKDEIKTLSDGKKAAEEKAAQMETKAAALEDKVEKLAKTPIVQSGVADFGKFLGVDINQAVDAIRAKGLFKHELTEKGRQNAALCAKFLIAVTKSKITGDRKFYQEFCKSANVESSDAAGGYLVPEVLQAEFIQSARETSFALQKCTVFNMGSSKVLFPGENALPTAAWVDEASPISASNPTYLQIPIEAKKAACLTEGVSSELLQDSIVSYVAISTEQMIYALSQLLDNTVQNGVSGDSVNFQGLLVAATGIQAVTLDTDKFFKDVSYDNIVDATETLTSADRSRAAWCLSRYGKGLMAKLKDDNGNPIWASAVNGEPASILGQPYFTSEFAPGVADKQTASKIFAVLGDWSKYYIGIRNGSMMLDADPYTNFATDLIRHRMTLRAGGNPIRKSAFVVLKAGASSTTTTTTTTTSTTSA